MRSAVSVFGVVLAALAEHQHAHARTHARMHTHTHARRTAGKLVRRFQPEQCLLSLLLPPLLLLLC